MAVNKKHPIFLGCFVIVVMGMVCVPMKQIYYIQNSASSPQILWNSEELYVRVSPHWTSWHGRLWRFLRAALAGYFGTMPNPEQRETVVVVRFRDGFSQTILEEFERVGHLFPRDGSLIANTRDTIIRIDHDGVYELSAEEVEEIRSTRPERTKYQRIADEGWNISDWFTRKGERAPHEEIIPMTLKGHDYELVYRATKKGWSSTLREIIIIDLSSPDNGETILFRAVEGDKFVTRKEYKRIMEK